jgi:hypothetical protein
MLSRSLWILILAVAAAPRMTLTGLSPAASSQRGINQTTAVATAVDKRKRRRETPEIRLVFMAIASSSQL